MKYSTKKLKTLEAELWFNSEEMNLKARLWETRRVGGIECACNCVHVCVILFGWWCKET